MVIEHGSLTEEQFIQICLKEQRSFVSFAIK